MRLDERDSEVLRGLCELRYLSGDQIQRHWFKEVTAEAARRRMWQLGREGLVRRVVVSEEIGLGRVSSFRLTARGIATVRNNGIGSVELYEDVGSQFLRHLLDTNEVFLALADSAVWEALRFHWHGSHRVRFSFVQIVADPRGGPSHHRHRLLVPDALVTPKGAPQAPRCFIELDRATETIAAGRGRNSIERKLLAYRALIHQLIPGRSTTAYAAAFPRRSRPARVVFVVASKDDRRRRVTSILTEARRTAPELDVHCLPLADTSAIRAAILPWASDATTTQPSRPRWGETTFNQVVELRDAYVEAAPDLRDAAQAGPDRHGRLRRLALACRALVLRARDRIEESPEALIPKALDTEGGA